MSFQDLLKQPLPSQMGDDYITEAVTLKDIGSILKGIGDLKSTYKTSTKEIKESIKSIKNQMSSNKFKGALNSINICRKKVISDRNEISKQIKALESKGLTKGIIKKILAGEIITAGASGVLNTVSTGRTIQKGKQLDSQINKTKKEIEDLANSKERTNAVNELNRLSSESRSATASYIKKSNEAIANKDFKSFDKLSDEHRRISNDYTDQKDKHYKTLDRIADEVDKKNTTLINTTTDRSLNKKHLDENIKAAIVDAAVIGGAYALTKAKLGPFVTISETYEKYYDGVQKTLDELEDKCEKQSQNIKECLLDFVMLNQDMEMLMESVEESEYMEAGKVENLNKIRVEVKKYKTMSKDAVKELKDMVTKIREQIKAGDFKSAKQAIKSCRTKLNDYRNKGIKQRDLIKSLGLNNKNIDKFGKMSGNISKAGQIALVGSLVAKNERWRTAVKADDAEKANNKKDLKKYEKQYDVAKTADKGFSTAGKVVAGVGIAAALGAAYIFSYYKCVNATLTYFTNLPGILDDLEKKCKTGSRDIKESMIDFVIATQDIEMVLESAEEIDYIDEE
jgi:Arc/MetJ-type ribon-helix-helix transcriptional regulator